MQPDRAHLTLGVVLLVFVVVVLPVVSAAWPASALAYAEPARVAAGPQFPAVCPPRPADAGTSAGAEVVALVTVAQELADACTLGQQQRTAVLTGGELRSSLAPVVSKLAGVRAAVGRESSSVTGAERSVSEVVADDDSGSTTDQVVALDQTDTDELASVGDSLHGDLWVLIGCVVGCFAMAEVLRRVLA
ncbi:MAG: hypothetical protein WA317_00590 [Mycobacterium sp.]|uniref:hypothetical protein n=1 Tax=Mycobacterium sp. TaxID=1785 RepID=UPI003CC56CC5